MNGRSHLASLRVPSSQAAKFIPGKAGFRSAIHSDSIRMFIDCSARDQTGSEMLTFKVTVTVSVGANLAARVRVIPGRAVHPMVL